MDILAFILWAFLFFTPIDGVPLPPPPSGGGGRIPIGSELGHSDIDEPSSDKNSSSSAYGPGLYICTFRDGSTPACQPVKTHVKHGTVVQKCGPGLPSYILCTLLVPGYGYLYTVSIIGLMPGLSRRLLMHHRKRLVALEIGRIVCVISNTTVLVANIVGEGLKPITIMSVCQWTMDLYVSPLPAFGHPRATAAGCSQLVR